MGFSLLAELIRLTARLVNWNTLTFTALTADTLVIFAAKNLPLGPMASLQLSLET